MSLFLRIDNVDTLPDGGPLTYEVNRRGLDIGRDPYLDWTLPDPERFISGKHAEIRYRDGGYWLHDVSTNGTSLNGRGGRLAEPHRLQDGDRIHIGHYIIAVELRGEAGVGSGADSAAMDNSGSDPWSDVAEAAAAVSRRDFTAAARAGSARTPADLGEEDISWSMGEVTRDGPAVDDEIWAAPAADDRGAGAPAADWGWTPPSPEPGTAEPVRSDAVGPDWREALARGRGVSESELSPAARAQSQAAGTPVSRPEPPAGRSDPFGISDRQRQDFAASSAQPASRQSGADSTRGSVSADLPKAAVAEGLSNRGNERAQSPQPPSAPQPLSGSADGGFVSAFERGAGMPAGSVAAASEEVFAEEIGFLFRLVIQHLQAMLLARAETKSAMRSAERTMIGALENNPLKFSPTPEDALRIMFGTKTRSYLDARETIESSFSDLQKHQLQTFAAMQEALNALIEDLDPKNIEEATATDGGLGGLVGSRRARSWDTYVERFRSKSGRHERGMADAFMVLFAEMYDQKR